MGRGRPAASSAASSWSRRTSTTPPWVRVTSSPATTTRRSSPCWAADRRPTPTSPRSGTRWAASSPATTWWRCGGKRTRRPWRSSSRPTLARVLRPPVPGADRTVRRRPRSRRCSVPPSPRSIPPSVFFPMGLANPDHVMVHDACLLVGAGPARTRSGSATRTTATSTCPACSPGGWRSSSARPPGRRPPSCPHVPDEERKRRAIWCYTSQIAPLEQDHALTARMEGRVPEQFWHLAPPPSRVGGLADFI